MLFRSASSLDSIVSRENSPLDPAVITVGSIHGGTRYNIIPDEVNLQLTVRTYKPEVRQRILTSIERIVKGVALTMAIPEDRAPTVKVSEGTGATYNEPKLMDRLVVSFKQALGEDNVVQVPPIMASEDFAFMLERVPGCYFFIGNGTHIKEGGCSVHNPEYDFNDKLLPVGAAYWATLVERYLDVASR